MLSKEFSRRNCLKLRQGPALFIGSFSREEAFLKLQELHGPGISEPTHTLSLIVSDIWARLTADYHGFPVSSCVNFKFSTAERRGIISSLCLLALHHGSVYLLL